MRSTVLSCCFKDQFFTFQTESGLVIPCFTKFVIEFSRFNKIDFYLNFNLICFLLGARVPRGTNESNDLLDHVGREGKAATKLKTDLMVEFRVLISVLFMPDNSNLLVTLILSPMFSLFTLLLGHNTRRKVSE